MMVSNVGCLPFVCMTITDNHIHISHSAVITVGYALTDVIVLESDGVAQLTVAISMPPGRVPIETSFYLRGNTIDGSAEGMPYTGVQLCTHKLP